MKNINSITKLSGWLLLAFVFVLTFAGGPADGHTHGDEVAKPESSSEKYFSSEVNSDKYEMLLRYETIVPGEKEELLLFVSEFASNRPVDSASIQISAQEDASIEFSVHQLDVGTYRVSGIFPEKKHYSLAVNITSKLGPDLMLMEDVEVGKELPHDPANAQSDGWMSWKTLFLLLATLAVGIFLGTLLRGRNSTKGKSAISILLLLISITWPVSGSIAHGGEDHGAKKQTNNFSNSFSVPKETQFLFEIFTEVSSRNNFLESTNLFGTIIPSSDGQALVSAPQNGKIISLSVKVGQQVTKGQQLAVLEQNIDAATQVNFLTEKNNLNAELEAARKEVERLNSIQDIIAKKDLDEAKSRLQKAEANLKMLNNNAGKTLVLSSPISGVMGNFTMSIGSTINAGETLFTVTDLSVVYTEAQVFDKDVPKISMGAKYLVECSNDNHKTGDVQLISIAPVINATNQSQRVLFELNNSDKDFKVGEFVNIRVFSSEPSRQIALPNSAISEINGKPVVFIKNAAEKISVAYVQLGEDNGSFTTILKGVEPGERVVINGSYQMKMIFLNQ